MVERFALVTFREGNESLQVQHIRDLSKQAFERINSSISSLISFSKSQSLYKICQVNYEEIWDYLEALERNCKTNQRMNEHILFEASDEINRKVINYLSSFRTFHDHKESKFKRLDKQQPELIRLFKEKTAFHYDNNYIYQFFWRFRNYVQHCGLPVGKLEVANRLKNFSFVPSLLKDELLKDFDWTQKTREFIENQPQEINLLTLLHEFHRYVQDINSLCSALDLSLTHHSWTELMEIYEEVQNQFPNSLPSLAIFETNGDDYFKSDSPGQRVKMIFSRLPLQVMKDIQELILQFESQTQIN